MNQGSDKHEVNSAGYVAGCHCLPCTIARKKHNEAQNKYRERKKSGELLLHKPRVPRVLVYTNEVPPVRVVFFRYYKFLRLNKKLDRDEARRRATRWLRLMK